jgi:hypothetical protein
MIADGLRKVAQGLTSMDELYRVCDFKPVAHSLV